MAEPPRDPRMIHSFDQFGAMLSQLSGSLWVYYQQLRDDGFSDVEAMELVLSAQECLLMRRPDADEPS